MNIRLTKISSNAKTGPIPVSTSSSETCPDSCPLKKENLCYGKLGPIAIWWSKVTKNNQYIWKEFLKDVSKIRRNQLWRHNQVGDMQPSEENKDQICEEKAVELANANRGKKGFSYTHYDFKDPHNRKVIKQVNDLGFTLNVSTEKHWQMDLAISYGLDATIVLPSTHNKKVVKSAGGNRIVTCPATYNNDVQCANCGLCQKKNRGYAIGFPAHATKKKELDKVL